jgi:hypothetical protein
MEKIDTLHHIEMTTEQKELTCSIINNFGCGQHPVADLQTYDGFARSYLKSILDSQKFKKQESNLSELGKKTLEEIRAKL